MFDKLIESDVHGAEFKGRSRYFMVSTVVVGILFVTALVFSLYAADIGLGVDSLEVSMMVAPVTPTAPEPPPPVQQEEQRRSVSSELPTRVVNMLRPDETPTKVPTDISVSKNTSLSRPVGDFTFADHDTVGNIDPNGIGSRPGVEGGSSSAGTPEPAATEVVKIPDPPAIKPREEAPKVLRSIGVVNGKATYLPKPSYPATALAVHAEGEVTVQVMIDETGKVVSAKAVSGHVLLKREAERAAWNARFTPTLLSKVPVKVTGMIIYNFKRN
jgi:TonB family protein